MRRLVLCAAVSLAFLLTAAAEETPVPPRPVAPAPVATQLEPRQFVVFFEHGEVGVPEDADSLLPQVVEIYKRVGFSKIGIECHSDKLKSPEQEIAVSTDRASRIKATMVLYGVAAEAITTVGLGYSDPLVPGATPDRAASNRRCAITLS